MKKLRDLILFMKNSYCYWHIESILKAVMFRIRYPFPHIHSNDWSELDHTHICIAARILSEEDFISVCPCRGKCDIEWSDSCDNCKYMKILEYNTDKNGQKDIELI